MAVWVAVAWAVWAAWISDPPSPRCVQRTPQRCGVFFAVPAVRRAKPPALAQHTVSGIIPTGPAQRRCVDRKTLFGDFNDSAQVYADQLCELALADLGRFADGAHIRCRQYGDFCAAHALTRDVTFHLAYALDELFEMLLIHV